MELTDILDIVADSPLLDVGDGEMILVEGEQSSLFVLVSGALEVRRQGTTLARVTEPGAIVGEIGLLLDQPAGADVIGVGSTVVRRIDRGAELVERSPEFLAHLATTLARRLSQVTTYLTDLQAQFADSSATLGLVPTVLREILDGSGAELDVGSEREPDSPY